MPERLTGLIAAPHTPMHADGGVNLPVIERQAELLRSQSVRGAFICGTTGEGFSLTLEERMRIAERWAQAAGDDLVLIVHVGHHCLVDAERLAAHAAGLPNLTGIAAMAPSYYKPATAADLAAFLRPIAAAAPETPFFYYHIPAMNGVALPAVDIIERAAEVIPTLSGVKYTHIDMMEYQRLVALDGGRFEVLIGGDPLLLAALMYGGRAAIGITYNYAARPYLDMIAAFEHGDLEKARRLCLKAVRLRELLAEFGLMAAGKAIMAMRGVDVGPPRPPLRPLPPDRRRELFDRLAELDVLDPAALTAP